MLTEQEQENEELISELNELKTQMVEMQNQMTEVMASFQSTQSKMNNCCGTTPSEKSRSETGAIELEQNFPNPFEDVTTINFSINEPAQIRLEISDAQGRVLDVVVNQRMDKGEYTERWDGSAVAPGTYYYSLYADTELLTKKMIKR
jgi:flagellar hook assembly protein FlgD